MKRNWQGFLMSVKEESEKADLKLNIQKVKIMACSPIMANRWGKSASSDRFYFLGLQNPYGQWLQPWNWKMLAPWKKRYDKAAGGLSRFSRVWLCIPMNRSTPGSSVHEISQARILAWVAMPSSGGSSWPRDWIHISYVFCIGRQFLYHSHHLGIPWSSVDLLKLLFGLEFG